jgi:hypothetical protein
VIFIVVSLLNVGGGSPVRRTSGKDFDIGSIRRHVAPVVEPAAGQAGCRMGADEVR